MLSIESLALKELTCLRDHIELRIGRARGVCKGLEVRTAWCFQRTWTRVTEGQGEWDGDEVRAGKPQVMKSPALDREVWFYFKYLESHMRASVDKMGWRMGRKQGMGVGGSLKLTREEVIVVWTWMVAAVLEVYEFKMHVFSRSACRTCRFLMWMKDREVVSG